MIKKVVNNEESESDKVDNNEKSKLIPEAEDYFYNEKKTWKWKPFRLILLSLGLNLISLIYMFTSLCLIKTYLFSIELNSVELKTNVGIVILAILTKKWWNSKNDNKRD
jgi:hypothetical protein